MAIPFLGDIKDLLGIAGSGAQLWNMFRDDDNPALDEMMAENRERRRLRDLALKPNDPEFLNMVALREEQDRANFAKEITEAMKARRRAVARGAVTTRPERFDETISRLQGRVSSGPRARQETQATLLAAAGQPDYRQAIAAYDSGNKWDTLRTDAGIRAGMEGANRLYDMWSRGNQMPSVWQGVSPGRKPAGSETEYKYWEGD